MREFLLFVVLALSGCVGLSPHSSPVSITAPEIGMYKWGIKKGCTDRGIRQGDDPERRKEYCSCLVQSLDQSMSHSEWQQATYAAQNRQDREEMQAIGPHLSTAQTCRKEF